MLRAASPTLLHRSPLPVSFVSPSPLSVSLAMATHQNPPPPPERGRPRRVVVCGGGVIGACAAYFLAQKGGAEVAVTVVERSSPACAASGKAGGFLALDWCDSGPLSALARPSFALHRSLSSLLDGPSSYGYRPLHTLSLPLLPHPSPSSSSPSPSLPSWIDGASAAAAGPPRTLGTPETTAQVHPRLFTAALLAASGAELVVAEAERVVVAEDEGRAVGVALRGRADPLPADAVVLALGPWTARLGLVASLFDVSGIKVHSIVLRPSDPSAISPHALFLSYRPEPGAKLLDPEVFPRPTGNN